MIKIKGNSGCQVEVINDKKAFIRKKTFDKNYIQRLEKQASKQSDFTCQENFITVPKIFNKVKTNDIYYFDMEYFHSLDAFTFLEMADKCKIDFFLNNCFKLIDFNIKQSTITLIERKTLILKLKSIDSILNLNSIGLNIFYKEYISKTISEINENILDIYLPVGVCHGDLTLSNILIQNDQIILIDFLDSFIETPLQDVVKLRQDTKHYWSFNLLEKKYDFTKLRIIMNYLDKKIDDYFKKYEFYNKYYVLLQKINLLRIVPYAKDDKILEYIMNELKKINGESNE